MESLQMDIEEVSVLLQQANRPAVKIELQNFLSSLKEQQKRLKELASPQPIIVKEEEQSTVAPSMVYENFPSFSWDQNDTSVNISIPLPKNVAPPTAETVKAHFTKSSVDVKVIHLNHHNYHICIPHCFGSLIPETCGYQLKKKSIQIKLTKAKKEPWNSLDKIDISKPTADKNVTALEETGEPNLMKMMQNLYMTGDDDMKRMIAKTWTEYSDKNKSGNL